MESQTDSNSTPVKRTATISLLLEKVQEEVSGLVDDESKHHKDILKTHSSEIRVLKDAYNSAKQSESTLQHEVNELKGELEKLRASGRIVLCLVDGDDLLAQGKDGGHRAGQMLSESVRQQFLDAFNLDISRVHFWVHIFYNKRGLMDAIGQAGHPAAKQGFEDFTIGFNEAGLRFVMVDVSYGKDKVDKKITAMLEDYVRFPQICKILFGGCHDVGYVQSLRSEMTAGFGDKLVLLRGYRVSEPKIDQLGLPSISIPNLFIEDKLVSSRPRPLSTGSSYSSVVRAEPSAHNSTRTLRPDAAGSVYSNANDPLIDRRASPSQGLIRVDPNTDIRDLNPPPCIFHYLLVCKNETDCKYGHHYDLQPEHHEMLETRTKATPCTSVNNNEECSYGDICLYGHVCPNGTNCRFKAQGTCKFTGTGMHNISTS